MVVWFIILAYIRSLDLWEIRIAMVIIVAVLVVVIIVA